MAERTLPRGRGVARYGSGVFCNALGTGFFFAFALLFYSSLAGASLTAVGRLLTATALIVLPALLYLGRLVDRYGARSVLVGAAVVRGSMFWVFVARPSLWSMALCTPLLSLGARAEQAANPVLAVRLAPAGESGSWLALSRVAFNAGIGSGALVASLLTNAYGSDAYGRLGVLTGAACMLGGAMYGSLPRGAGGVGAGSRSGAVARTRPWRHADFARVAGANALLWMAAFAMENALPVYVLRHLGLSSLLVGVLFATNTLLLVVLQIPLSRPLERLRGPRLLAYGGLAYAALYGAASLAAHVPKAAAPALLVCGMVGYTLGEIAVTQSALVLLTSLPPREEQGSYMAFNQVLVGVTTALSPLLATVLLAHGDAPLWVALAAVSVVAAVVVGVVGGVGDPRPDAEGARPRRVGRGASGRRRTDIVGGTLRGEEPT